MNNMLETGKFELGSDRFGDKNNARIEIVLSVAVEILDLCTDPS